MLLGNCASLALFVFYSFLLFPLQLLLLVLYYILFHLVNCSYLNPQSLSFSDSCCQSRGGERASGCVILSCGLGLNDDIEFPMDITVSISREKEQTSR